MRAANDFCLPLDFCPMSAVPWFFLVVNLPIFISLWTYCLTSVLSVRWFFFLVFLGGFMFTLFCWFKPCTHPPLAQSTGLPALGSSIFLSPFVSYLLLYIIAKSFLSSPPSLCCSPLCSGWSPCGTPCRVPNLFIISALCKDARGMLKYMPPHSGYKWAAVSRTGFPLTWPQGWTELPNTHGVLKFRLKAPTRCSASNRLMSGYVQVYIFLISSVQIGWYSLNCVF